MTNRWNATSAVITPTLESSDQIIQRGGRHWIARRVILAMIERALERAQVQPEQRARICQARDRALEAIDEYLQDRDAAPPSLIEADLREQVQRCFLGEPTNPAPLDARRAWPDYQGVVDSITRSIRETHSVLTPAQRKAIAVYVRGNL